MLEISKNNAEILGKDTLLQQTMEECGELVAAIGKFNRVNGLGQKTEVKLQTAQDNLFTEIADVSICIEQLVYLLDCEEQIINKRNEAFEKVKNRYN